MAESISIWIGIISFFAAVFSNLMIWLYTYGKLQGKIESRERELDNSISTINSRIDTLEKSHLDSDGDPKWLTRKLHTAECEEHSKRLLSESENLKTGMAELRKTLSSIQDSVLSLATSGKLRRSEDVQSKGDFIR